MLLQPYGKGEIMRIKDKDNDGLRRLKFDYDEESNGFKLDKNKLNLLSDIIGTNFQEEIEKIVSELDNEKDEDSPKTQYNYTSPEKLKELNSNPIIDLMGLDLTLQELEEKIFIHLQQLEDEYPAYSNFQYDEMFVLNEDGSGKTHFYLTGIKNVK